ncbi:MAG: GAF domain-containing protein [Treponema sp.]|nr:GAF domain-containing protein [Treponema sp.]
MQEGKQPPVPIPETLLAELVEAALEDEIDLIAGLANAAAAIKMQLDRVNWAGFYILKGKSLVLGPFQGLPACSRIEEGQGVCGKAAAEGRSLVVSNVHEFPGHIACDAASNAEIVIPLFKGGAVWGVLDIDSPEFGRFGPAETASLEEAGALVSAFISRAVL